jgi:uncharacterized membrane protein
MARSSDKTKNTSQTTLTLKLTLEQRDRLRRIVESRAKELQALTGQELNITASDIVRWLIDREAEARGFIEPKMTASALAEAMIPNTIPMSSTDHVPVSSTMPDVLRPLANVVPMPNQTFATEPTLLSENGVDTQAAPPPAMSAPRTRKVSSAVLKSPDKLRERIEDALSRGRFKQRELAEASGISRSMVSRFVRGGGVTAETLRLLASGFETLK